MKHQEFWDYIEPLQGLNDEDRWVKAREILNAANKEQLINLERKYCLLQNELYRWDLWQVGQLAMETYGNDLFSDFMGWIVFQGPEIYEMALTEPDSLASFLVGKQNGFLSHGYFCLISSVYKDRFECLIPVHLPDLPWEPPGTRDWSEKDLPKRFPKTWALFGDPEMLKDKNEANNPPQWLKDMMSEDPIDDSDDDFDF